MPGFDGTGPRGQGPMTGGGFGRCTGGGSGPGFGAGFGREFGRGMGRGYGRCGFAGRWLRGGYAPWSEADEKSFLESRLRWHEQETASIRERLNNMQR